MQIANADEETKFKFGCLTSEKRSKGKYQRYEVAILVLDASKELPNLGK
ncbi:hypothetical protein ABNX05_18020 [Lysinibacillus sp. M3]|uniref:Uncharacterized protein n=1 Tax=Lysinibacillus zambalensis TaxID=3160866 RepID=A0ABV1MZ43_9BACI